MSQYTHVQYTQTDTNRQETLTNGTIGKNHYLLKKPYDLHHWYEWKSPQSIGIPFVNCISLAPLEPIAPMEKETADLCPICKLHILTPEGHA